jgi:hypothetical protein
MANSWNVRPPPAELPVRPMSNLLLPVGIPHKARCRTDPKDWVGKAAKHYPCLVTKRVGGSVVYDEDGAMPKIIASWIGTTKGIRQLQYEELAKSKGMDVLLKSYGSVSTKRAIREGVRIHLWTAVLDSIGTWLRAKTPPNKTARPSPVTETPKPAWRDANLQDPDEKWTWEPPDLSEGSQFFQDRVKSLEVAISVAAPSDQRNNWRTAGLEAL